MMSHIFAGSCKTVLNMKKQHHLILCLFIVGSFIIGNVKGRKNPLVDLSTREELVYVAGYGEEKLSTVIITGQVLCLSCVDPETQISPQPVPGASIVVQCGHGKKKNSRATSTTDAYGDFSIDLPSHLHAIPNLEKICYVIISQLPRNNNMLDCDNNSLTIMHKKHRKRKIKLIAVGDGTRTYTTESIHIISKPKTHETCKISLI